MIIEPVQGEGGVRAVPDQCLKGLRDLCTEHGVLLIYDEIQCGGGRTGKLFHHQWVAGAEPDILAAAKGIGGGFPMGMILATEEAASGMAKGVHMGLEQVRRVAGTMQQGMESLKGRYPELVLDVTGSGLLRGLRMKDDPIPLRAKLSERGLLVGTAGNNTLRLAPPLVVTEDDVREAIDIIDQQFASMMTAAGS